MTSRPLPPPADDAVEVWKFGGTSVRDAERISHVARLVAGADTPPVIVLSACSGVTDALEAIVAEARADRRRDALDDVLERHRALAREIVGDDAARLTELRTDLDAVRTDLDLPEGEVGAEDADRIRAAGERWSTRLLAAALERLGVPARVVPAETVVRTDARFGAARPSEAAIRAASEEHLRPLLAEGIVPIVAGFAGATADGRTTTLGRGGSDLTATLLGAALRAREVHIWTDVEGILTGDPRAVDRPRVLEVVGYEEAVELAWFGAKVLHPGAAKQSIARGVPVRIRSTFAPEREGTLILKARWGGPEIVAVAHKPRVVLITVRSLPEALPYGFLARVFEILARHELPVDLVATSHTSTAFTLDEAEEIEAVARELRSVAEVEVRRGMATVTVVGHGLLREPGFDARVFRTVADTPIHLISQASDVSLSFLVDAADAAGVVARLHGELVDRETDDTDVRERPA